LAEVLRRRIGEAFEKLKASRGSFFQHRSFHTNTCKKKKPEGWCETLSVNNSWWNNTYLPEFLFYSIFVFRFQQGKHPHKAPRVRKSCLPAGFCQRPEKEEDHQGLVQAKTLPGYHEEKEVNSKFNGL